MHHRIAALTLVAVAVLGLTACSDTSSTSQDGSANTGVSSSAEETTAAADDTDSEQSLADACLGSGEKLAEASGQLAEASAAAAQADSSDPQSTIDAFTATVEALGALADTTVNPEAKGAYVAVHDDFEALRDALSAVLVDKDYGAAADVATAASDAQESITALQTLCAD